MTIPDLALWTAILCGSVHGATCAREKLAPVLTSQVSLSSQGEEIMEFFTTLEAKAMGLPFSMAVRVGDVLYLSGALGHLPGKMQLMAGGIEAETRQTMENVGATLRAHGLTLDNVFKCTVMLADMSEWAAFNR